MAKKDNTLPIVIGAAVIGGGAYYAYKKGLFGKKGSSAVAAQNAADASLNNLQAAADTTQAAQAYNPLTNPNSYEGKVAFIQATSVLRLTEILAAARLVLLTKPLRLSMVCHTALSPLQTLMSMWLWSRIKRHCLILPPQQVPQTPVWYRQEKW